MALEPTTVIVKEPVIFTPSTLLMMVPEIPVLKTPNTKTEDIIEWALDTNQALVELVDRMNTLRKQVESFENEQKSVDE